MLAAGLRSLPPSWAKACADEEEEAEDGHRGYARRRAYPSRAWPKVAWRTGEVDRRRMVGPRVRCVGRIRGFPCGHVVTVRWLQACGRMGYDYLVAVVGAFVSPHRNGLRLFALASAWRRGGAYVAAALFAAVVAAWFFRCGRLRQGGRDGRLFGCGACRLWGPCRILPLDFRASACACAMAWPRRCSASRRPFALTYCGTGCLQAVGCLCRGACGRHVEGGGCRPAALIFRCGLWGLRGLPLAVGALTFVPAADAFCLRRHGCLYGVLVFGLMARAFIESGFAAWMPDPADIAVVVVVGLRPRGLAHGLALPSVPTRMPGFVPATCTISRADIRALGADFRNGSGLGGGNSSEAQELTPPERLSRQ